MDRVGAATSHSFREKLVEKALRTLKAFFGGIRLEYLPVLLVYFAYGAAGITSVAATFWIKKHLNLGPEALAAISFWIAVPWTMKMVFGQFADSIRILGSARRIYLVIGALLIAAGQFTILGMVLEWPLVMSLGTPGNLLLVATLISVLGFVLQDVVADAMSAEVVRREDPRTGEPRAQKDIDAEIGQVQWLGRVAIMTASVLVAGAGGWLAKAYGYAFVYQLALGIPALSLLAAAVVKPIPLPRSSLNWWILGGGLLFAGFATGLKILTIPYAEEIVFMASLAVLAILLSKLGITKELVISAAILFVFRATPGTGAGTSWWMIDVLGFDENFQGWLAQIGTVLGLAGLFIFRKFVTEKPIHVTLAWLTVIGAVLYLPTVGLYYGVHQMIGLPAKIVAVADTAVSAPFGALSMVPLLMLIARSAPAGQVATWFALMASLMNLALSGGELGTIYMNRIFLVERGHYENLGALLLSVWSVSLVAPLAVILLFKKHLK